MDPRTPCIIGVAQETWRGVERDAPEPLEIWGQMAERAAADSGGHDVLSAVDSVNIAYTISWQYDDPTARLAARLGLGDGDRIYSGVSGTTPQKLLNEAAREIFAGRREMALVVSGEALATKRRLKKRGSKPDWSFRPEEPPPFPRDDPHHPAEVAHNLFQAYVTFAMFDVARRAHLGMSPEENRQRDGELLSRLTGIAANNPKSWFPIAHSARELIEVTPQNRMVSYPYAKNMVAIMDVDMGSAIILTSHEKADALGVPKDRRVTLRSFCAANDPCYVAERDELWRSRAMEEASREALGCAGIGLDDVKNIDLYSCFASSVNFARDALGLSDIDTRPLTMTGGLPYFGGPGSGYMSHSIVSMVEALREEPAEWGLVSGVGMHMQKHVFGIYSGTPDTLVLPDEDAVQARVKAAPVHEIQNRATGPATVAAYTVLHNRQGPKVGILACDLQGGARCYAHAQDTALMRSLMNEEWVGKEVTLVAGEGEINIATA